MTKWLNVYVRFLSNLLYLYLLQTDTTFAFATIAVGLSSLPQNRLRFAKGAGVVAALANVSPPGIYFLISG